MRLCMRNVNPGGVSVPYNGKYDHDYCFFEVDALKMYKYPVLSRRYRKTTLCEAVGCHLLY